MKDKRNIIVTVANSGIGLACVKQFIENGAFYMFQPSFFLENNNRFAGNIGCVEMDNWKFFEIDETTDVIICEVLMKNFIIKK